MRHNFDFTKNRRSFKPFPGPGNGRFPDPLLKSATTATAPRTQAAQPGKLPQTAAFGGRVSGAVNPCRVHEMHRERGTLVHFMHRKRGTLVHFMHRT